MHLEKPTVFVKGEEKRTAYFTVEAKEFRALGYVEESEAAAKKVTKAQPKPAKKSEPKHRKTSVAEKVATKAASYFQPSEVKSDE